MSQTPHGCWSGNWRVGRVISRGPSQPPAAAAASAREAQRFDAPAIKPMTYAKTASLRFCGLDDAKGHSGGV